MEVRVLVFGPAASAVGRGEVVVRVSDGVTCGEVLAAIAKVEPRIAGMVSGGRLAVNHEFAAADRVIVSGDEVALIAMVSGG